MCVNYKISQNPPKMLELAVEHLAAFSEILDEFQVLASLKWNEILWVIFEVETKLNGFWGPRTILRSILKCPIFVYYTLWNLQCAGLVWCSLRLSILGTGQLCTGTVAQCPRYSVSGCTTQVHQQRGPVSKCTGTWARYNLCTVSTKCAEAESYQVHWQSGRPGARQSMATACNCPLRRHHIRRLMEKLPKNDSKQCDSKWLFCTPC